MQNKERALAEVRYIDALDRVVLLTKEGQTAIVYGHAGARDLVIGSWIKLIRDENKRRMTDWAIEP